MTLTPEPAYGQELLLDLHGCDVSRFNRTEIRIFLEALCDELDMEAHDLHFWDDVDCEPGEEQIDPKTKGHDGRPVPAVDVDLAEQVELGVEFAAERCRGSVLVVRSGAKSKGPGRAQQT